MQHKEIDVSDYKSLLKIPRINSKAIEPDDYFISMESVENFREVKNYIGFHGMTIKPGRIYRSGMIGEIAEADIKKLKGLGIKSICDLRARNEVANSPDRAIEGIKYENIQVDAEKGIINVDELKNFFRNDNLLSGFQRKYLENLITGAKGYGTFLKKFTADENMAVLCHCTHGKDRTGIAICLLLMLLKVDENFHEMRNKFC